MPYKLLGLVVWRVGKWYVSRRMAGTQRKLAIAGVSALVVGGVVAAGRQRSASASR